MFDISLRTEFIGTSEHDWLVAADDDTENNTSKKQQKKEREGNQVN